MSSGPSESQICYYCIDVICEDRQVQLGALEPGAERKAGLEYVNTDREARCCVHAAADADPTRRWLGRPASAPK
jgi:hypothetical protein